MNKNDILPEWFRTSFKNLDLHVQQPITFGQLKEVLRPFEIWYDIRHIDKYQVIISDSVSNSITKHESLTGAVKHVLSTIISKLNKIKI